MVSRSKRVETRRTRPVSWIGATLKRFEPFPEVARIICLTAVAGKPMLRNPARAGVRRIQDRLPFKGDAFRVIYAAQFAEEIWVVHAFQKKSTQGIKTPNREIDLIKDPLKRLKEMLR